jgi:hypothetical protein
MVEGFFCDAARMPIDRCGAAIDYGAMDLGGLQSASSA